MHTLLALALCSYSFDDSGAPSLRRPSEFASLEKTHVGLNRQYLAALRRSERTLQGSIEVLEGSISLDEALISEDSHLLSPGLVERIRKHLEYTRKHLEHFRRVQQAMRAFRMELESWENQRFLNPGFQPDDKALERMNRIKQEYRAALRNEAPSSSKEK